MILCNKSGSLQVEVVIHREKLVGSEGASARISRIDGLGVLNIEPLIEYQVTTWLDAMHQFNYRVRFNCNSLEFTGYIESIKHQESKSILKVRTKEIDISYHDLLDTTAGISISDWAIENKATLLVGSPSFLLGHLITLDEYLESYNKWGSLEKPLVVPAGFIHRMLVRNSFKPISGKDVLEAYHEFLVLELDYKDVMLDAVGSCYGSDRQTADLKTGRLRVGQFFVITREFLEKVND
jgi:hypothetical protein